ncbi:MAG TPA: hypothetical protein VF009_07000 [Solirubrobacterales bacterium]
MTSTTKSLMAGFAPVLLLFLMIALLLACYGPRSAHATRQSPPATSRVCFPAAKWGPAPDAVRPCVEVTRLFEDGSFSYRVTDADGTVRYSAGIGALDR